MTSRQLQVLVGLLVVVVIGAGLVFLADSNRRKLAERTAAETAEQTETAAATEKTGMEQQQAKTEETEGASVGSADKPSFDVARFEPNGDGVLAGLAKPGALVELLADGEPISSTTANEVGEWVIVLEKPLGAGSHDLAVRAAVSDNEKVLSDEFIAVVVPETPEGEVLVVASEPGKASEILARPSAEASTATEKPSEMASAEGMPASADAVQAATTGEGSASETQVAAAGEPEAMKPSASAGTDGQADASTTQPAEEKTVAEAMTESSEMAKQMPADADGAPGSSKTMEMAAAPTDEQTSGTMTETGSAATETAGKPAAETETVASATGGATMPATEDKAEQAVAMASAGTDTTAGDAAKPDQAEQSAEPGMQVAATAQTENGAESDAGAAVADSEPAMPEGRSQSTEPNQNTAAKSEPEPAAEEPKREFKLVLEAVETEGNMVYAAGTGNPGTVVRVYADDNYVGEASTDDDGRWLLETEAEIAAGNVVVRADELQEGSADVSRRAEVPFFKQADAIALLPTTAKAGAGAGENASGGELLAPRSVIIRSGDNLWTISRRTYGRGIRYTTIYKANDDQIRNPHMIFPGQVFVLPEGDAAWTQ